MSTFNMFNRRIVSILFALSFTLSMSNATHNDNLFPTASACQLQNVSMTKGFKVNYFDYPLYDSVNYSNTNFLASGYLTKAPLSSAYGVPSASIHITNVPYGANETMMLYGMNILYTHFLFEYTAFFIRMFSFLLLLSFFSSSY